MLHGPIGGLGADDDVDEGDAAEESEQPAPGKLPVHDVLREPMPGPPTREKDSDGDHRQAGHENDGDDEEDHDADVGIVDMSPQLHGEHEQPGEESRGGQPHPQEAQPVTRDQHQERAIAQPVRGGRRRGVVFHRASLLAPARKLPRSRASPSAAIIHQSG